MVLEMVCIMLRSMSASEQDWIRSIPAGDQRRVRDTRPGCERAVVRRTSSAPCAAARPLIPGLVGRGELVQSSPSSRPDPPGVHPGRGSAQGTRHPAGMRARGRPSHKFCALCGGATAHSGLGRTR